MIYVSYTLEKCDFQVFASIFMHALCKITLHISVRNLCPFESEERIYLCLNKFGPRRLGYFL